MLQEVDINKIIRSVTLATLPEWKRKYYEQLCTNLQVHTKGLLFAKVDTLFPNEHPDSKAHCVNTYEPITKGSVWKAINDISRIFSNSSFSVSSSDVTAKAIEANSFESNNLFNWFLTKWIENAVASDANGWCAVYPAEYVKLYGGDQVRFIKSEHLRLASKDMVAFVSEGESKTEQTTEEAVVSREIFHDPNIGMANAKTTVVKTYNKKVKTKILSPVYHVFTPAYLLRFWKEDEAKEVYSYKLFPFKNKDKAIPCFEAGGVEVEEGINESFVAPFIPFGNLALLQHRNHRAVDLMFSYPRMSEVEVPCVAGCIENKANGTYLIGDQACKTCKGSGFISVQSPYKVYRKRIESGLMTDEQTKAVLNTDPVSFHTPEVGILTYSKDSWKEYLRMAEEAVFVYQKKVGADAESFESKMVDMEGKFAWLLVLSKAYFRVLRQVVQSMENYLSASPVEVSIEEPTSFAILTESEAFAFLNIIVSSDAPIYIKHQHIENFVHKFISKSSPIVKALRILKKVDPLLFYSDKSVQTFKSNSAIRPETWTTHIYAYPVLMQLYEDDKKLFEKNDKAIIDLLKKTIVQFSPMGEEGDLKTQLMAEMGGTNALKDSVGGLTGMIEIAKAVASGLYDLDAAIALVSDRFGISEQDARRQLGTPTISESQVDKVVELT